MEGQREREGGHVTQDAASQWVAGLSGSDRH